jgi:hypothetical protein
MNCIVMGQGAEDAEFVRHAGKFRHQFADLNPRNISGNRFELAANLRRSIGLHVPQIHLRRATSEEDEQAAFRPAEGPFLLAGVCSLGKKFRQRQAGDSQRSDAQKVPPAEAVTEFSGSSQHTKHVFNLSPRKIYVNPRSYFFPSRRWA